MIKTWHGNLRIWASVAGLCMVAQMLPMTAARADANIKVVMNQAKIIKLARPAGTVVVGNPEIADAVVQDSRTIVLTGKGYGVTNLVVMDSEGDALVDEQIAVSASDTNSLRVYRRADIDVFSCTPYCEPEHKAASAQ
ncbi:MAG: pilus assembly protein N-terminal domain-containing protein [Phyllobacterium sp.]